MAAVIERRVFAHEKVGHTRQGLWHHKGMQLPALIQHVATEMEKNGHSESEAVHMAVGIVKNWAAGHDGHGHHVHPGTVAEAAAAIAEWEKLRAQAHASTAKRSAVMAAKHADGSPQVTPPEPLDYEPDASWAGDLSMCPDLTGLSVPDFEDAEASLGMV